MLDSEILSLPIQPGPPRGYRVHCRGRKAGANAGNIWFTEELGNNIGRIEL